MTAYHATHPSPYDDACPDCAGYSETKGSPTNPYLTGRQALALFLAVVLILVVYVVGKENR